MKYGSHSHWILYQFARNKLNSMMRKAKSDYFRPKIAASKDTEPKASWKWINSFTGKGNKSSPVNDILVKDKIVSDYKNVSESFNDFLVIGPELWPMNQRKGPPMLPHLSAISRIAFKSFDSLIYRWKSHPTPENFYFREIPCANDRQAGVIKAWGILWPWNGKVARRLWMNDRARGSSRM